MKKLFLLCLAVILQAVTITGEGVAEDKKVAKKEALVDLSSAISSNVKSEYRSYQAKLADEYKQNKENFTDISTNLPKKGVKFRESDSQYVKIIAILDENSLKVYKETLKLLKQNIDNLKNKTDYDSLKLLLKNIQQFNKNKIVAIALGGKDLPKIDILESDVKLKLKQFSKLAPNIDIGAKILANSFKEDKIYIQAPKIKGSKEITQFANIFKNQLSKYINASPTPQKANYILRGEYDILKNSIFITYNLYDKNNNLLKTDTIKIKKVAGINYKPKTKSFDEALNSEPIINNKLRVKIGFRGFYQEDGIDLKKGDKVDIVVKSNKPICYFLVGHVLKDKKFSYLLYLNEDTPINYLTGEEVNRFVLVASDVEIAPPFGSESLQIFASTLKKGKCPLTPPKCKWKGDYCVIVGKPKNVVKYSRGLVIHHNKTQKAESSITWTSFKK